MNKYHQSKIYNLICDDGYFYVGSTCMTLHKRRQYHGYTSVKAPTIKVYEHILSIGWDRVRIELVEEFKCESKKELLMKEQEHIRLHISNLLCLNSRPAYLTDEEKKAKEHAQNVKYRAEHLETIKAYDKKYKEEHPLTAEQREQMRVYQREYMRKRRTKAKENSKA